MGGCGATWQRSFNLSVSISCTCLSVCLLQDRHWKHFNNCLMKAIPKLFIEKSEWFLMSIYVIEKLSQKKHVIKNPKCTKIIKTMPHVVVEERLLWPAAGLRFTHQCRGTMWEEAIRQPPQSAEMHISGTRGSLLLIHKFICSASWLVKSVSVFVTTQPWHNEWEWRSHNVLMTNI